MNKNKAITWAKENPKATGTELNKQFTIDRIMPTSYMQRMSVHTLFEFPREKEPSVHGPYGFRYVYDTTVLVEYAIKQGHKFGISKHTLMQEEAAAHKEMLEKRNRAMERGQHILSGLSVPEEIRAKRFLTETEIVSKASAFDPPCGVYFLIDNYSIVYVGQSTNVFARIMSHRNEQYSKKVFDRYAYIPCPKEVLDLVESIYIMMFTPKYNGGQNGNPLAGLPISYDDIIAGKVLKRKVDWMTERYSYDELHCED